MSAVEQTEALWPLISKAPWQFLSLALVLLVAGWAAGRFMFNERIATLKEQLAAYKEKLAGASPDEVASKIASLEKRLDSNLPTVVPIEDVNRFGDHEASQRHRLIPPREQRGITISRNLPQAWRSHFHGPRSDLVELLGNAAT